MNKLSKRKQLLDEAYTLQMTVPRDLSDTLPPDMTCVKCCGEWIVIRSVQGKVLYKKRQTKTYWYRETADIVQEAIENFGK
jgi:hypothetical protein